MAHWKLSESSVQLTVDDLGRAEVSLTLTNDSAEQDRAVLTVEPQDGAAEGWFSWEEPGRTVPGGGSAVYLLKILVPKETPPGTYGVEAVAYSADDDPGSHSTRSKRIAFTVVPKPVPKGLPKWLIPAIALVVVLVIAVVAFLVFDDDAPAPVAGVPTIAGTPEVLQTLTADAATFENADDFEFQWRRCNTDGSGCSDIDGAVLQVYQLGNADGGVTVRVRVTGIRGDQQAEGESEAFGPINEIPTPLAAVPPVIGQRSSDAFELLSAAGFVVASSSSGQGAPECDPIVNDQTPPAGSQLSQGSQTFIVTGPRPPILSCIAIGEFFDQPLIFLDEANVSFPTGTVDESGN